MALGPSLPEIDESGHRKMFVLQLQTLIVYCKKVSSTTLTPLITYYGRCVGEYNMLSLFLTQKGTFVYTDVDFFLRI